jgi:DNA-binding transcriptional LysR family regulator
MILNPPFLYFREHQAGPVIPSQVKLAEHRFILRERGSGTLTAIDLYFRKMRFRPNIRLELGSNEAIKQAVAGGLGIAVLSRHALGDSLEEGALKVLDVSGFPIHSHWFTVHLKGKRLSPTAQAFLEFLGHQARQIAASW